MLPIRVHDRTWSIRRGIAHRPDCVYARLIHPQNRRNGADWRQYCWRACRRCRPDGSGVPRGGAAS